MSAEIMEKANELAEAIADSEELKAMRKAELAMNSDDEAVDIINEFREKQQGVYEIQMRGEELSDRDKEEIQAIEDKMSGNPSIKAYMEATEKFEHLMKSINMIISRALSGESSCGCGTACGPECGPNCGPGCN